ncbi:MAG: hypothetical protein C0503_02040 [Gemmatimonas sp.]|nr:hypothetical protein [Gemmatimonas sp.]
MLRQFALFALVALASACATTGATLGSGVGDAMLSRPPWYAGARATPVATAGARVGVAPIAYQKQDIHGEVFDPSGAAGSPMAQLLAEMNAYLDSLTAANGSAPVRLLEGGAAGARPAMRGTPPDVRFGCLREGNLPANDCEARGDSVLGRDANLNQMKLEVGRPSAEWTSWFSEETANSGVEHALVITIELGEYIVRQRGFRSLKYVELGSNHRQDLPWLTSLERPVQVLQLTGALVGRDGKALRIGAEGIVAKRSGIVASGFGLTALITDDDVAALRTLRRGDLPGRPLAWQEALRTLVKELTR